MSDFDEARAVKLIKRVRLGDTLRQACANEEELLQVYDWLEDPKAKIGEKPFAAVYAAATHDQRRTWADMAKDIIDDIELNGDRADTQRISEANNRARFYVTLSKETHRQTQVTVGDSADKEVSVTIRKFNDSGEQDE